MRKLTRAEFEKIVKEGIEAIPEKFLCLLDNVAIVIEDEPTPEQKKKMEIHEDETLFGLYEGVPLSERGSDYTGVLPDKITIFKKPTEEEARLKSPRPSQRSCRKAGRARYEAAIKEIVRDTVWHEIAHHFGMDESRVEEVEKKRKK